MKVKSKAGKVLKSTLAASFAFSLVTANPIQILAAPKEVNDVKVDVYPKPQEISYISGEGMKLEGEVNVVFHGDQVPATLTKLEQLLKENNISYSISNEIDDQKANILISSSSDHCDECTENLGGNTEALTEEQGYILSASNDVNEKGEIKIIGADSDGAYYGLMTLTQMLEQQTADGKIAETVISDYPTVKLRGFVEGFYGYPWSFEDRLSLMSESSNFKMNTYIYAPKDDPYHKDRWRELYPADKAEELHQLAEEGKKDNMSFCWSVHPGYGFNYSNDDDYNALINKFDQLYDLGVRQFGISYDDLSGYVSGQQHADLINRVNREWVQVKGDVKPLIVVGTRYCNGWGPSMSSYFRPFWQTLDSDVVVMWTGANTMSAITKDAYNWPKTQTGVNDKNLAAWWNYPVNDYCDGNLMMSPLENLDNDVDNLSGFFLNPMSQAEASKVAIFSGADYSWNTPAYDYNESFKNSIVNIYGDLAPYMYTFANHSSRLVAGWASTGRADAPEVRALMDEFIKKNAKGEDVTAEVEALTTEFDNMILAANKLQETLTSAELSHCNSNLTKLKSLGEADKIALDLFIAIAQGNTAEVNSLKSTLQSRVNSLSSGKLVSELTALAFVKEAINYNPNAAAGFEVSNTFVLPGQEIQLTNTSSVSSTDLEWTFEGANIESSTEENPVISYAKEGVYTISLKAKNKLGEDEIIKEDIITVSNEADGNIVNLSVGKSATATSYTGASEAPNKAIDGISSTKWCATGYNRPHTLTIDLGKEVTVNSITISHAEIGGEGSGLNTRKYRVQVSIDGTNYTEVVNVSGNTAGLTTDYFQVSLARYVKLIVDEPTQGGDSAARIYEVEVKGLDKAITIPPVYNPVNKQALSVAVEMASAVTEADLENVVPAVVEEFNAALDAARIVLEDERAKQDAIDSAFERLANAMHMLEFFKGDKALLQNLVDSTADLVEENYTEESWSALQEALTKADEVLNNVNAMQEEVDEAYDNLQAAINGLEEAEVVDKSLLEAMVNKVLGLEEDKYIESTWSAMLPDLEAAQEVLGNEKATQAEVDEACDALTRAYLNLRLKPNKDLLSDLINKANGLNAASYTANTWAVVENEVIKAKEVLEDPEASEAEVKAAEKALTKAIEGLVAKPGNTVDTSTPVKPGDTTSVKTGDTTNMIGALGLLASLTAIACLKKKKYN